MDKICVNCGRKIKPEEERYFEVREYAAGRLIETKHVHKTCQDKYNQQIASNTLLQRTAMGFIANANQFLKKMGGEEGVRV